MITTLPTPPPTTNESKGVFDYLSPSRLNLWIKCPLAFKFKYVDGIKLPPTPNMFLGKRVHDGLELFYRHRQLGIYLEAGDVTQRMLVSWDAAVAAEEIEFDNVAEETALKQQSTSLVTVYLRQLPADEPRPLAVETSLTFPLVDPVTGENLGMPLLGIVDLVIGANDGPVIADFKTAAKSSDPLEITHEVQLSCYAYLFRHVAGQSEAGLEIRSLIKTKTPKVELHRYAPRTDIHFRRLFALIRAYLDDLHSGRFVYRPGWTCSMCDYRDTYCRQWQA